MKRPSVPTAFVRYRVPLLAACLALLGLWGAARAMPSDGGLAGAGDGRVAEAQIAGAASPPVSPSWTPLPTVTPSAWATPTPSITAEPTSSGTTGRVSASAVELLAEKPTIVLPRTPLRTPSSVASGASSVGQGPAAPAATPTPSPMPTVPMTDYRLGGLYFADAQAPLNLAYPADYESGEMVRWEGLEILPPDMTGANYARFVSQFGGTVFVYPDRISGSFVLNVHDGIVSASGRVLEAEPLRQLIEGNLYAPYSLSVIQANLDRLVGREWVLSQNGQEARFRLVLGRRMSAADVAAYKNRAAELSSYIGGLSDPQRSFMMFFCSGRQPGEPRQTFAGRYLLVLELAS